MDTSWVEEQRRKELARINAKYDGFVNIINKKDTIRNLKYTLDNIDSTYFNVESRENLSWQLKNLFIDYFEDLQHQLLALKRLECILNDKKFYHGKYYKFPLKEYQKIYQEYLNESNSNSST